VVVVGFNISTFSNEITLPPAISMAREDESGKRVFVYISGKETPLSLLVEDEDTVLDLKRKIWQMSGVRTEQQSLRYKNIPLVGNKPLGSYDIIAGGRIALEGTLLGGGYCCFIRCPLPCVCFGPSEEAETLI